MKKRIITLIGIIGMYLVGVAGVRAQSLSLSISPPILEVMIKPGKSVTQVYKIANNGEAMVTTLKLVEMTEVGIKEDPSFVAENWITVATSELIFNRPFLLPAKVEKQLIIRINPPLGTKEQDYYRAIVLTTSPPPAEGTSISSFSQQLASPLLIRVTSTGLLAKSTQITKFDLPTLLDSFTPLKLNIEVKNTGSTYFRPIGKITLTGLVGKGEYTLAPVVLLVDQTRKLLTENQLGTTVSPPTLSLSGFFLGKYQVGADFTLDEGTIRVTQTKTFYALPWKAGVGIVAVAILMLIIKRKRQIKP